MIFWLTLKVYRRDGTYIAGAYRFDGVDSFEKLSEAWERGGPLAGERLIFKIARGRRGGQANASRVLVSADSIAVAQNIDEIYPVAEEWA